MSSGYKNKKLRDGINHLCAQSLVSSSFIGQTLAVFGGVNFNHGDYSASLDGGPEQV